jgi:SSS family solute:Na+ symporter
MRSGYLLLYAAYLAVLLGAGLAFSRRMRTLSDYFLAGRSLGAGLIFVSLTSAWFGATSILVSSDEALRSGLSALWVVGLPAVATVLLLAFFFSGPLHRLPIFTWSDLVEMRYGRIVRHLTAGLLVWYMAVLAASQMVALGTFLGPFLGLSYGWSLAAGVATVLVYSSLGGLRSVVFTDLIQFVLLAAGVVVLFVLAAHGATPGEAAAVAARTGREGFFNPFHRFGENGLMFLSFTLAWTISPIALQRIRAAKSIRAARRGLGGTAAALFLLYALVVGVGLLSLPRFAGVPLSRPLVAELIAESPGFLAGGLVFVAVLAAILSTLDTALNAGALVLTRDILEQAAPRLRERPVAVGRAATLIVGAGALLVALRFRDILGTIGLSSEILAEGFFIPGLAMVFLKGKHPRAGLLALLFGGGFAVLSFLGAMKVLLLGLPAWPRSLPFGLALSAGGFLLGSILDRRRAGA